MTDLFAYSIRDLFDRRTYITATAIVLTVALVTGLSFFALAIPEAANRAQTDRLKQNPLALTLWAWPHGGSVGQPISDQSYKIVADRLKAELGGRLVTSAPFHEIRFQWVRHTAEYSVPFRGRDWSGSSDPLANYLGDAERYCSGGPFADSASPGVIVTRRMVNELGYSEIPAAGTSLTLQSLDSGAPISVPLVGVLKDPLPLGHSFVLTSSFCQQLQATEPDYPCRTIRSGPVPKEWHDDDGQMSKGVAEYLLAEEVSNVPVRRTSGELVWSLTSTRAEPHRISAWRRKLRGINETISRELRHASLDFEKAEFPEKEYTPPSASQIGYQYMGMSVRDLNDLEAISPILDRLEIHANEGIIPQMKAYRDAADAAVRTLEHLSAIVALMAAVSLLAMSLLRILPKKSDIGMLRAVGMSNFTLILLYGFESLILGIAGIALGVVLSFAVKELGFASVCYRDVFTPFWIERASLVSVSILGWCKLWTIAGIGPLLYRSPAANLA